VGLPPTPAPNVARHSVDGLTRATRKGDCKAKGTRKGKVVLHLCRIQACVDNQKDGREFCDRLELFARRGGEGVWGPHERSRNCPARRDEDRFRHRASSDGLFGSSFIVIRLKGERIASAKRRNPWTSDSGKGTRFRDQSYSGDTLTSRPTNGFGGTSTPTASTARGARSTGP
jgi:hypothetical protein